MKTRITIPQNVFDAIYLSPKSGLINAEIIECIDDLYVLMGEKDDEIVFRAFDLTGNFVNEQEVKLFSSQSLYREVIDQDDEYYYCKDLVFYEDIDYEDINSEQGYGFHYEFDVFKIDGYRKDSQGVINKSGYDIPTTLEEAKAFIVSKRNHDLLSDIEGNDEDEEDTEWIFKMVKQAMDDD